MSELAKAIVQLIENFMQSERQVHGFLWRFSAAWWGAFVFHFVLIAMPGGVQEFTLRTLNLNLLTLLGFGSLYSAMFALVSAVGSPKGSLIRQFLYGVLLPFLAYTLAGTLLTRAGG